MERIRLANATLPLDENPWSRAGWRGPLCELRIRWQRIDAQLLSDLSALQSSQADKHKGITIVSGRHGSERGNDIRYEGGVFMPLFRFDYTEYKRDLEVVASVKQNCPNAKITVVYAGDDQHFPHGNTAHALKAYAKAKLSSGEDVIFQWCYSVSAMRDFIRPADPSDQAAKETEMKKLPVAQIASDYDWDAPSGHRDDGTFPWRTGPTAGVAPPSPQPLDARTLEPHTLKNLAEKATQWLATLGVTKAPNVRDNDQLFLLGDPELMRCGNAMRVVSKVINERVGKGWSPVQKGQRVAKFSTDLQPGLYTNVEGRSEPVYVHDLESGVDFFNTTAGACINEGIVLNAHLADFLLAPYHEILHKFEGNKLSACVALDEGSVELFSVLFADSCNVKVPVFPGYLGYFEEADKLARGIGRRAYAKAFFEDDAESLDLLPAFFYAPTANYVEDRLKLRDATIKDALSKIGFLRDSISTTAMQTSGSWYDKWVKAHNNQLPTGGIEVVPKKKVMTAFANLPLPPIPTLAAAVSHRNPCGPQVIEFHGAATQPRALLRGRSFQRAGD
jgi:hypothetical protein